MKNLLVKSVIAVSMATLTACAVTPDGRVGTDPNVFGRDKVIPLGAGILSAVVCNKLFDGHGSKDGWTAACGAAGYFASTSFVKRHNHALEANRVGQTTHWKDPDGGRHSVTPERTYYQGNVPCRDFRQTVEIDGQVEVMKGKACRQSDGSWRLVS